MLLLWNPWNSCACCSSPCSEHLRLWGSFDFIFFFSLRILQTLGSTEASAEFITVALERGKKELALFLLPCCVFFFPPLQSPSHQHLYTQTEGRLGTFQPLFSRNGDGKGIFWAPTATAPSQGTGMVYLSHIGLFPFLYPGFILVSLFFILVKVLSLIFTSVEVPPLIFYLGNTICFRLKRELHAR